MLSAETKAVIVRHLSPEPPIDVAREIARLYRARQFDWGFVSCANIVVGWGSARLGGAFSPDNTDEPVFGYNIAQDEEFYSALCDVNEAITGEPPTFAGPITSLLLSQLLKQVIAKLVEKLSTIDWAPLIDDLIT